MRLYAAGRRKVWRVHDALVRVATICVCVHRSSHERGLRSAFHNNSIAILHFKPATDETHPSEGKQQWKARNSRHLHCNTTKSSRLLSFTSCRILTGTAERYIKRNAPAERALLSAIFSFIASRSRSYASFSRMRVSRDADDGSNLVCAGPSPRMNASRASRLLAI